MTRRLRHEAEVLTWEQLTKDQQEAAQGIAESLHEIVATLRS